jgi:hypothetical protein
MAEQPSMVVRISGNLDELKKSLADGKAVIDGTRRHAAARRPRAATCTSRSEVRQHPRLARQHRQRRARDRRVVGDRWESRDVAGHARDRWPCGGAAFAGWKIGRKIAEFFDFDTKIGDVTAKLLGFGDVAATGSRRPVRTRSRGRRSSPGSDHRYGDGDRAAVRRGENAQALNTSANRIAGWNQEIAKVKSDGNWQS